MSEVAPAPLCALPPELFVAVLDALPLDAALRCRAVAKRWRNALRCPSRLVALDLSADATAAWRVRLSGAAVAGALACAAAATDGAGATLLDLSGQAHLDGAFLYTTCAAEADRVGGGALETVTAPEAMLSPAAAADLCALLPRLSALTVSMAALGSESGASLAAALAPAALRCCAFALSPAFPLRMPPAELAAALAPQAPWLTRLDLSASRLTDAHVEHLCAALLRSCTTADDCDVASLPLRELDLSENELTGDAATSLADALLPARGGALRSLNLSGNKLGVQGLNVLAAALQAQHAFADAATCQGADMKEPLPRLVMQCVAGVGAERAFAAAVAPRTHAACGYGAHTWRLWGAA